MQEDEGDYISLEEIKTEDGRKQLLAHDLGFVEKGYVSLCQSCGGCGSDNENYVPVGEQSSKFR